MTSIHPFRPAYTRLFIHSPIFHKQCIYCGPSTYQVLFFQYKTFPSHQKSRFKVRFTLTPQVINPPSSGSFFSLSIYLFVLSIRDSCKRSLSRGTWNSWFQEPEQAEIQTDGLTISRVKVNDSLNDLHKGSRGKWGCGKCLSRGRDNDVLRCSSEALLPGR